MDEVSRKVLHDIQSPVSLIRGFCGEVAESLSALDQLLKDNQADLPEAFHREAQSIVEEGAQQCLEFIGLSANRLDALVDDLRRREFRVQVDDKAS